MMQNSNTMALPPFHVLIVAGGRGSRMGESGTPKQYLNIGGKPVLRHTIEAFLDIPGLQSLRVVIHPDDQELYMSAVSGLNLPEPVIGGKSRKSSVFNGLSSLSNASNKNIILIHDAARPCIKRENIVDLLNSLEHHQAATLACPIPDTIRRKDTGETINRDELWSVQTPQAFRYEDIMRAHEQATPEHNFTDDASMVFALGINVALIEGVRSNIKITVNDDIALAAKILDHPGQTRTGMGFDVHAFDFDDKDRKLMLGGIEIPYKHGLKGHSDADVALHTITDALLGALGEGDIGQHFPPSNSEFKNIDSAIFLQKALYMLKQKNGSLINLDLTIICEAPKIGPYRDQIRKRIADILELDEGRINIKATTTEKLGFTGRGEGIAAQAVVSIEV